MNNTRFKDGRLGIGRTPIFPLDVSGNTRIEGDLVLKGTIADASGVPIYFGHAGVTSTDGNNNNYHIGINKATATDANFPLDVEGNVNINNGNLFINGDVAEFSNWTDIGETEESGIYRNSKVAIGKTTANHILDVSGTVSIDGDILLNGTTMDPNPSVPPLQDYTDTGPTWKDATIITTVASSSDTTQALTTALNDKADKASPEFSGNVGIGKEGNASYALDILGDVNISSGALKLNGSTPVYSNWTVHSNTTDIYRPSGNVGIGTTDSKGADLMVNGYIKVVNGISFRNQSNYDGTNINCSIHQRGHSVGDGIQFNGYSGLVFTTNNGVEQMRITRVDGIGIGTTSPKSGLQVIHDQGLTISGTATSGVRTAVLRLGSPYTTDVNSIENYCAKITSTNNHTQNYGSDLRFFTHPNGQSYNGSSNQPTERMCILGNGNVGIGTDSPGAKLEVKGDALNNGAIYIKSYPTTDKIFELRIRDDTTSSYPLHIGPINSFNGININNSNGNVGIGTASPEKELHIKGDDEMLRLEGTDNPYITFYYGSTKKWSLGTIASADNKFYIRNIDTTGDLVLLDTGNGNVGIGTTSPGAYLHVRSTDNVASYAVPQVLITADPASSHNQWASLELRGSYIGNTVPYGVGIRTTYGHDSSYRTYGDFNIYTTDRDNGNARTNRLTVTSTGNVGIGTTPSSPFDVKRTGSAGRIAQFYSSAAGNNGISIGPPSQSDGDGYIEINGGNSSAHGKHVFIGCTRQGQDHYDSNLVFKTRHDEGSYTYTSAAERMRIQHDGNVGIGTPGPAALLDVNGHGWCRTLCVGSYGSFASIDGGDTTKLCISNSSYNGDMSIEFSGYTNGHRGGNQALARIICRSDDNNNYENHKIIFKIRGWGTNNAPHHQPLNNRFQFDGSGYGYATSWSTFSDDRVKHNEKNITNAMEIINKLNAKLYFKSNDIKEHNYNYELDNSGNPITDEFYRLEAGFIAQELKEVPELKHCVEGKEYVDDFENCFKKDTSGNIILDENNEPVLIPEYLESIPNKLGVSYNDIFVYNVVATQELDKKVSTLETENQELKTKVANLEAKLQSIEQRLAFAGF